MFDVLPSRDSDYPGYAEAVARENLVRGAACLGWREKICGCEVMPLTAFHVRRLGYARTPFFAKVTAAELCADEARHEWLFHHAMIFLWTVSPMFSEDSSMTMRRRWWESRRHYERRAQTPRDQFNRAFAGIMEHGLDEVCAEILEYVAEAYLDSDDDDSADSKSYFAFEISIAQELHQHYPQTWRIDFWNDIPRAQNPLHVPLKIVWQLRRARKLAKGETVANASEKIVAAGLAKLGEKMRRTREYERELHNQKFTAPEERYTGGDDFNYGVN